MQRSRSEHTSPQARPARHQCQRTTVWIALLRSTLRKVLMFLSQKLLAQTYHQSPRWSLQDVKLGPFKNESFKTSSQTAIFFCTKTQVTLASVAVRGHLQALLLAVHTLPLILSPRLDSQAYLEPAHSGPVRWDLVGSSPSLDFGGAFCNHHWWTRSHMRQIHRFGGFLLSLP